MGSTAKRSELYSLIVHIFSHCGKLIKMSRAMNEPFDKLVISHYTFGQDRTNVHITCTFTQLETVQFFSKKGYNERTLIKCDLPSS